MSLPTPGWGLLLPPAPLTHTQPVPALTPLISLETGVFQLQAFARLHPGREARPCQVTNLPSSLLGSLWVCPGQGSGLPGLAASY